MNNITTSGVTSATFADFVNGLPTIRKPHPGFAPLLRGVAVLPDQENVTNYYAAYGQTHVERLQPLLQAVVSQTAICAMPFQTVDWGCGALLATYLLRDTLTSAGLVHHHRRAVGTDASAASLQQARRWWERFGIPDAHVTLHDGYVDSVVGEVLASLRSDLPTLHLAANFLDISSLQHASLGAAIGRALRPHDVFAAVSPVYGHRLDNFRRAAGLTVGYATPDYSQVTGNHRHTAAFIAQLPSPTHN